MSASDSACRGDLFVSDRRGMWQLRGFFVHSSDRSSSSRTVDLSYVEVTGLSGAQLRAVRSASLTDAQWSSLVSRRRQRFGAGHARHVYRHRRRVAVHASIRPRRRPPLHRAIRSRRLPGTGGTGTALPARCDCQHAGETRRALDDGRASVSVGRYGAREPACGCMSSFRARWAGRAASRT